MTVGDFRVALVTGASRGVGRGIAAALAQGGVTVYATGRTIDKADLDPSVHRVVCDHADDAAVARLFQRIDAETGQLDVLVNNAWGGYERMVENGKFTWTAPFWEQPAWRWDAMMGTGVRAAFVASQLAARRMLLAKRGLIVNISVNISYWAARKQIGNLIYGLSKAATDKLTEYSAAELEPHGVTALSLYPGLVRTEGVVAAGVFDLSNSESPEFVGRAIAALASDPDVARWNGKFLHTAELARIYDFTDVDGRVPSVAS